MKIRIKGNSLRLRLSKTEVEDLVQKGTVVEKTQFSSSSFLTYQIKESVQSSILVEFSNQIITVLIPKETLKGWDKNQIVGFKESVDNQNGQLNVLIEKDFKCLTEREDENEEDHFENPLSSHNC
jgi:hypothetical protein